ncbi:MAG: GNAT family N-acetyltransferase [Bacteroidia bacterium]
MLKLNDLFSRNDFMNSVIRPYKTSDKGFLIEIFKKNIPEFFAPEELSEFIEFLEVHHKDYLTIEVENRVVGGLGHEHRVSDASGRINWVFIHPQYKGLGFGKDACLHCMTLLTSNPSIEKLLVRTSQHAAGFFKSLGYEVMSIEKDYWAEGFDLYLMKKGI